MNAVVTEFNLLGPYGEGLPSLWQGLQSRETAFSEIDRFDTRPFVSRHAALVPDLDPASSDSLVFQMIRRLLPDPAPLPTDATLLLATTVGAIDRLEQNALRNGNDPEAGTPERLLAKVHKRLGTTGPARIVSAACASSTVALAEAASIIRSGETDAVLVVACDCVSEFVFSGFSTLMALDPDGARPFDTDRKGLSLGEAAAWALVMSEARAQREGRSGMATLTGYGLSNDANHMTGPARDGAGLARAIRQALRSANQTPDHVAAIHAHGTGTAYNDAMEMKAFHTVFENKPRPVFSIKGAVGHTLGTAGLLETLVAMQCLKERLAPPTVGLRQPDPLALNWVSSEPQPFSVGNSVLNVNSGFGGINAALLIEA